MEKKTRRELENGLKEEIMEKRAKEKLEDGVNLFFGIILGIISLLWWSKAIQNPTEWTFSMAIIFGAIAIIFFSLKD